MKSCITIFIGIILTAVVLFGSYWVSTQPVYVTNQVVDSTALQQVPEKNQQIIRFLEEKGAAIAPVYNDVVCTEFVIKVIEHFTGLTKADRTGIRIITNDDLTELVRKEATIIKGVCTALVSGGKGTIITKPEDVRPGDFVQFWNLYYGSASGHCGIVLDIIPEKNITLYSSHPMTSGYGKQTFLWPDKVFFARLN